MEGQKNYVGTIVNSLAIIIGGLMDISLKMSYYQVNEMTAIGGVMIMTIGLNFLEIKRIKVGNMIPAVFIPILYF